MLNVPHRGRRLRWLLLGCGLLIFLWLGVEDQQVWPVALLGLGSATVLVLFWFMGRFGGQVFTGGRLLLVLGLAGSVAGLGGSICTVLLMLFKNARHAHIFPDFPFGQMAALLALAPAWALAGGLVGMGIGFVLLAKDNAGSLSE